jgi:hypothetical protein
MNYGELMDNLLPAVAEAVEREIDARAVDKAQILANEAINSRFYYPAYVLQAIREEREACANMLKEAAGRLAEYAPKLGQNVSITLSEATEGKARLLQMAADMLLRRENPTKQPGRFIPVDHKPAGYQCAEGGCGHHG